MSEPLVSLDELLTLFDPHHVANKKINCIKTVRAITGEGLREAKDFVEQKLYPVVVDGAKPSFSKAHTKDEIQELRNEMENLKKFVMSQWRSKDDRIKDAMERQESEDYR